MQRRLVEANKLVLISSAIAVHKWFMRRIEILEFCPTINYYLVGIVFPIVISLGLLA